MIKEHANLQDKTVEELELQDEYRRFLKYYCGCNPQAYLFVLAYIVYVHSIDDIIDKDNTDPIFIIKTFELAAMLYANIFYLQHVATLRPLIIMSSSTYMTSVTLEQANDGEAWKPKVADYLRQTGNEVILAIIQILHGIDIRIEASLKLRKISYHQHHDAKGNPC